MKYEGFRYQRVFQILKNKIESGLIQEGDQIPSGLKLCKEYGISQKTVRHVFRMLADEGLIKTSERKRAVATFNKKEDIHPGQALKPPDAVAMADIIKTADLLCDPLLCQGILSCHEADWSIPEKMAQQLDPEQSVLFWRNSKLFWRFFIARCENEFALQAVDSLGLLDLEYKEQDKKTRLAYRDALLAFVRKSRNSDYSQDTLRSSFADISLVAPIMQKNFECAVPEDSPFRIGVHGLDEWLKTAEERYSSVYLDILGLISIGYYKVGDKLPPHSELKERYGVSVNTTTQAIQILKQWGVVETIRGKGIFVSANIEALQKISVEPQLIASHVRRYLESVEFLSLTVEGIAGHAAGSVTCEEAKELLYQVEKIKSDAFYQPAPIVILTFLTEHIQYDAMRTIYEIVLKNYRIGRKIPKFVNGENSAQKFEIYNQCVYAVKALVNQDKEGFAKKTAEMFQYTQEQIIAECKRLNYYSAAKALYDGSQLWK